MTTKNSRAMATDPPYLESQEAARAVAGDLRKALVGMKAVLVQLRSQNATARGEPGIRSLEELRAFNSVDDLAVAAMYIAGQALDQTDDLDYELEAIAKCATDR